MTERCTLDGFVITPMEPPGSLYAGTDHGRLFINEARTGVMAWWSMGRCTDRSAGGWLDWRTVVTTRAQTFRRPDSAEASPRRRASWRSRGRWWRGPAARATVRPCRISTLPAGLLPQAAARYPWET